MVQKRLKLQQERIVLDREILEMDKNKFKKTVKLASKRKNLGIGSGNRTIIADPGGSEGDSEQYLELKDENEKLRLRLKSFQKEEASWKSRALEETINLSAGSSSSEKQDLKILELEKELREVKHEHTTLKKKHALEKKNLENGMFELVTKELTRPIGVSNETLVCSLQDEVNRLGLLVENYQAENKGLMEENLRLKRSSQALLKKVSIDETYHETGGADLLGKVGEKFDALLEEREILKTQIRDQGRQIDDWKLLLPRNQDLLEQTMTKNRQLMEELEEFRCQRQAQFDSKTESKRQTKKQQMGQYQSDDSEEILLDEMNTICIEHNSSNTRDISTMTTSQSDFVNTILIPSDLSPSDLKKHEKKFVIEWEWGHGENGLGGLYTGWLDLSGNPCGSGTLRIDDGGIYIGEWKQGLRNGNGVYTSIDGAIYFGPWLNDRFQGRGVFVSETNQVYTGDWKNGLRHGSGIETWAHGARYSGYYHLDKRDGV